MRAIAFFFRSAVLYLIAFGFIGIMVITTTGLSHNPTFAAFAVPLFLSISWLAAKPEVREFRPWEPAGQRRARGYVGYKSAVRLLARLVLVSIPLAPEVVWYFFDVPKSAGLWCAATALIEVWVVGFGGLFYLWRYLLRDYFQEMVWEFCSDSSWSHRAFDGPRANANGIFEYDPAVGVSLDDDGWGRL